MRTPVCYGRRGKAKGEVSENFADKTFRIQILHYMTC